MFDRIKKDEWIIAIRRKENCLLSRSGGGFKIIPNSLRYWCADPFLLDIDNTTFLLFEMYDREEAMDFDEYYKRFDEMIKSDENFTLEFIKPKSYQYSELLPLKLQRLISDEKIPDDKEIIYRIYYLNSLPNKTSNEAVNFAKETIKMIKEKNKRG